MGTGSRVWFPNRDYNFTEQPCFVRTFFPVILPKNVYGNNFGYLRLFAVKLLYLLLYGFNVSRL